MPETQQQANLWSETAGSQSAALHGLRIVPGYLGRPAQKALLAALREVIAHGVDRIMSGTSTLLPEGGRINLTLRRVTRPA